MTGPPRETLPAYGEPSGQPDGLADLDDGAAPVEGDQLVDEPVDGHLVVFHDDRLERTTNGSGYLCDQTFDGLRTLDAGKGQFIPTLEEVCQAVRDKASLNIELKGSGTGAPVARVLSELIDEGWDKDTFLVSSFHHRELLQVNRLNQK